MGDMKVATISAYRRAKTHETADAEPARATAGKIKLDREGWWEDHMEDHASPLIGTAWRSPVTGKVKITRLPNEMQDFDIVDLQTRQFALGGVAELTEDPYFFKPVPLPYRTWKYHHYYRSRVVLESTDEHSMFRDVLLLPGIDAPVNNGLWSPVMCLGPMALATAFTGDLLLVTAAVFTVAIVHMLAILLNNPTAYQYLRPVSLPVRLAILVYLVMHLTGIKSNGAIEVLFNIVALVCSLLDFIIGDGSMVRSYRYQCTYKIERVLPNRVFICTRIGADTYESDFGSRGAVSDLISGMSAWKENHIILADIKGLIVELRPMQHEDWSIVFQTCVINPDNQRFIGIDVYDSEIPNYYALEKREKQLQKYADVRHLPPLPNGLPPELKALGSNHH